ncbi:glycosyltransferase [Xanthobacter sp. KR7-65]|uniref:glycosyltransferase n=1 Tax=Xanthobacter sp. KR7-65 TaxID=3156612 RepID=UPI0032B3C0FC
MRKDPLAGGPPPPRPLRVALFVHAFYPEHVYGTEAYTLTLARQMRNLGHDPVVVTARASDEPPQGEEIARYTVEGIPVLRIDRNRAPARSAREDYDMPALAPLLTRILREIAPDVVHICHLSNFTAVLPEVAASLGIPIFATLTDFFNLCLTTTLQATDGRLCGGPDAVRANCLSCGLGMRGTERSGLFWGTLAQPALRDAAGALAARVAFALPGAMGRDARAVIDRPDALRAAMARCRAAIAPSAFLQHLFERNGATVPLVRSTFGIDIDRRPKPPAPAQPVRFGFMGQISYHKGPHLMLQALRRLPPDVFTLDLWGSEQQDPAYSRDLRAVAAPMPVRFRGTFSEAEMADLLAGIDVLILPSTWFENAPLTLLKALATHTPVIVADVPGMTEFVEEGVNGFAFPRGDAEALVPVLRRFVDDPGLAARMSRTTAYDRTERDMVLDVLALYRSHGPVTAGTAALTA